MKKIITFDIWDTILKRRCHPQQTKMITVKYLYDNYYNDLNIEYQNENELFLLRDRLENKEYQETFLEGKDRECNFRSVLHSLVRKAFSENDKIDKEKLANKLIDIEVDYEISMTYVNPYIKTFLKKYEKNTKYCISDFYMPKKDLIKILKAHNLDKLFKDIYVSVDYYKTKRDNGNLFKLFMELENINAEDILHFGDNEHSDIQCAKLHNIETHLVPKEKLGSYEINNISFLVEEIAKLKKDTVLEDVRLIDDNGLENYKNSLYNIGLEFAPLTYFYIYNLIEDAHQKGYDKIYYQTREGEMFLKYHNLIKENNPFSFPVLEGKLLEVSRLSTYAASIDKFTKDNMMRMWRQYKDQTLKALFKSLDINILNYQKYFKKYNLDICYSYPNIANNSETNKLFNDKDFIKNINKDLKSKKDAIMEYFVKEKILEEKKLYIVDLGWRGTIQDNIAYILKDKFIDGGYMNLMPYLNPQPINSRKYSFANTGILNQNFEFIFTIIEIIFMPSSGSVKGYHNGKAIRKYKKEELEFIDKYVKYIQQGMYDGAKVIAKHANDYIFTKDMYMKQITDITTNLKLYPGRLISKLYFSLYYNETFGHGVYMESDQLLKEKDKFNIFKVKKYFGKYMWKEIVADANDLRIYLYLIKLKRRYSPSNIKRKVKEIVINNFNKFITHKNMRRKNKNNTKKVLIASHFLGLGGVETALIQMLTILAKDSNLEITLCLEHKEGIFLDKVPSNVKIIQYCPYKFKNNIIGRLQKKYQKLAYKYQYQNYFDASIAFATYSLPNQYVACTASKNASIWMHGEYLDVLGSEEKYIEFIHELEKKDFKNIIFVSKRNMRTYTKLFLGKNKNKRLMREDVIYNLIDGETILEKANEDILEEDLQKIKALNPKNPKIIYVGRICEEKNVEALLKGVVEYNEKEKDKVSLILLGDGKQYEYLKDIYNKEEILFLGSKKNPYPYFKEADYLIISSKFEGFPVVFQEAMTLGLPILTTDVSDAKDLFKEKYGHVFKDFDIAKGIKEGINKGLKKEVLDYNEFNKISLDKLYKIINRSSNL